MRRWNASALINHRQANPPGIIMHQPVDDAAPSRAIFGGIVVEIVEKLRKLNRVAPDHERGITGF